MKKLAFLFLLITSPLFAQTSQNGRLLVGPAAAKPTCNSTNTANGNANPGDWYNDIDDTNNYKCMAGTWSSIGAGGGGSPAGATGDIQVNAGGGAFGNGSGTTSVMQGNVAFKGPNPYVDVTTYGVRAVSGSVPTTSATCVSSNAVVAIGSAILLNGDSVALPNCGAANTASTPAAPTVSSSLPATNLNTGFVHPAPSASDETTCYKIAARQKGQGLTAASPEACVTGKTRGEVTATISTLARSGGTVTVTVPGGHGLNTGCSTTDCQALVRISGTSDDNHFAGWFQVNTVPSSTTFTFSTGNSTANGSPSSATGGTLYYFNVNHLILPTPTGTTYQYFIYAGATGAEVLYGVSREFALPGINADSSYMTWDDAGATLNGHVNFPTWVPTSPPGSATNDTLVTTVSSGGGTTSVTLAVAPSNSASSTITLDQAANINTAAAAANTAKATLYFPATTGIYYVQSYLDLSSYKIGIDLAGPLWLNDTMALGTNNELYGTANAQCTKPQFGLGCWQTLVVGSAFPGIWATGPNIHDLTIEPNNNTNMYNLLFFGNSGIPMGVGVRNANIGGGSTVDYQGVPIVQFCQGSAGGCAGVKYENVALLTGPAQTTGVTSAPSFVSKNVGEVTMTGIMMHTRGMFFEPNQGGQELTFDQQFEIQGNITPIVTTYFSGGGPAGWYHLSHVIPDTSGEPVITNLGGFVGALDMQNVGKPSSMPIVTGLPFYSVTAKGFTTPTNLIGQNTSINVDYQGCMTDGVNATGACINQLKVGEGTFFSTGRYASIHSEIIAPAAPTCAVSAGGSIAPGNYTFTYAALGPDGGEWTPSLASTTCTTTSGNQTITVSWSAIPGATGYDAYVSGFSFQCAPPWLAGQSNTSFVWTSGVRCGQGAPNNSGSGPAGLRQSLIWSPNLVISNSTSAPTAQVGTTFFDLTGDAWPAFNVNSSSTKYFLSGIVATGTVSATAGNSVGCIDQTTTATGATTGMTVNVSPVSPQTNTSWSGYVSAANTVDIHVCTIVSLTGSAVTYNWSVIAAP